MIRREPSPLRKARLERGLSMQALSEISGVSHQIIQATEVQRTRPPLVVQQKLSGALGVPFRILWPERVEEFRELQKLINGTRTPKATAKKAE